MYEDECFIISLSHGRTGIITIVTSNLQPRVPRPEADLRPLLHGDGAQVTLAGPGDQLPPHDVATMRQILI